MMVKEEAEEGDDETVTDVDRLHVLRESLKGRREFGSNDHAERSAAKAQAQAQLPNGRQAVATGSNNNDNSIDNDGDKKDEVAVDPAIEEGRCGHLFGC